MIGCAVALPMVAWTSMLIPATITIAAAAKISRALVVGFISLLRIAVVGLTRGVFFVFLLAKILNWLHKSEKVAVKSDFYT
jgi:hypothetical protein